MVVKRTIYRFAADINIVMIIEMHDNGWYAFTLEHQGQLTIKEAEDVSRFFIDGYLGRGTTIFNQCEIN